MKAIGEVFEREVMWDDAPHKNDTIQGQIRLISEKMGDEVTPKAVSNDGKASVRIGLYRLADLAKYLSLYLVTKISERRKETYQVEDAIVCKMNLKTGVFERIPHRTVPFRSRPYPMHEDNGNAVLGSSGVAARRWVPCLALELAQDA